MIKFLELHIRNFYSYGNNVTIIPLLFTNPTLIIGENHDVMIDGEFDANGAGKSSILNALSYVLYGKPVSPVDKIDDIINYINKKNTYVAVIFEINGKYYRIERWRKNKKMGGVANNGVKITSSDTLEGLDIEEQCKVETPAGKEADVRISEDILHIPFDIFARIAAITPKHPPPFLSLPSTSVKDTSQTSILEEIFGQKELTEKGRILKDRVKETIAEIKRLTELNERIQEEVGRYTEQLTLAKESITTWNTTHTTDVATIKESIAVLEAVDYEAELAHLYKMDDVDEATQKIHNKIKLKNATLEEYENNQKKAAEWVVTNADAKRSAAQLLAPYKDVDFDKELGYLQTIEQLTADCETEIALQSTLKTDLDALYTHIDVLNSEVEILKSSKCPYCDQAYHGNESKIAEKEGEMKSYAFTYTDTQKRMDASAEMSVQNTEQITLIPCIFSDMVGHVNAKNKVAGLEEKLIEAHNAVNPYVATDNEVEIATIIAEVKTLDGELEVLLAKFKAFDTPLRTEPELYTDQARRDELKKQLVTKINETNPHEDTVERLTKVFESIDEPRVEEIDELIVKLEHQQFLLKLLTKKDSFIRQALLDVNLPLLNSRMRHYLDIIGLPHKVEFTKDMSIAISQFNNTIGYKNLSGGQQARINLAIAFSFRDVVQARHQKINVCVLDECLDTGLSNLGVKVAARMIKQVAVENELSMYVITHRDEIQLAFDKTLKAVLKGGLTTLEFS